jgi:hypothetical protein
VLSILDVTAEHWAEIAKEDCVVEMMLRHILPLTRDEYLALAYPDNLPEGDDWGGELEGGCRGRSGAVLSTTKWMPPKGLASISIGPDRRHRAATTVVSLVQ